MSSLLNNLDTATAGKILAALSEDYTEDEPNEVSISIDEQKQYLMRFISYATVADKKAIGNILVMNDRRNSLQWCSEGTIINLDALPNIIITQMYELLRYKMDKK
jgi:hypothetical protein